LPILSRYGNVDQRFRLSPFFAAEKFRKENEAFKRSKAFYERISQKWNGIALYPCIDPIYPSRNTKVEPTNRVIRNLFYS